MQSQVVPIYKPVGKTPLECVLQYKEINKLQKDTVVSYAGRLDPMAEGVLIILVGDINKKRRQYEHLDKQYKINLLFGVSTDTHDLMGKVSQISPQVFRFSKDQLIKAISQFEGVIWQQYPIFSSIRIRGKPLFWYARQDKIEGIVIPSHQVEIQSINLKRSRQIAKDELFRYIEGIIPKVKGDFRQQDIVMLWKDTLDSFPKDISICIQTLEVLCSSGTYMRALAKDIGNKLNVPICLYSITRTRVGNYQLKDCQIIF